MKWNTHSASVWMCFCVFSNRTLEIPIETVHSQLFSNFSSEKSFWNLIQRNGCVTHTIRYDQLKWNENKMDVRRQRWWRDLYGQIAENSFIYSIDIHIYKIYSVYAVHNHSFWSIFYSAHAWFRPHFIYERFKFIKIAQTMRTHPTSTQIHTFPLSPMVKGRRRKWRKWNFKRKSHNKRII